MADASRLLEFRKLLDLVGNYVASPIGHARLQAVKPGGDRAEVEQRLQLAAEAREYLRPTGIAGEPLATPAERDTPAHPLPFAGLTDPAPLLRKLPIEGVVLELAEISELLRLAEAASETRAAMLPQRRRFPKMAAAADRIGNFQALLRERRGKILPNGELDDRASPQLQRIRREIDRHRGVILTSLRGLTRSLADDAASQEDIVTVRGDRFVVPVRVGKRSQVKGVVHGSSSSGQTVYMEPLEAIELNNELVRLREEEQQEIHRILRAMTAALRERAAELAASTEALGVLDLAIASGRFAHAYDGAIPRFNPADGRARLVLKGARHPLLEALFRSQGKGMEVVPVSLELDSERRILVISGPNTGGKTVTLKTAGLLAMMALAGLPVPAESAEFPYFDRILADIGDSQSIQESLSTFSAHLMNISSMMQEATPQSLILLDELGSATDPEEAGALAVAIVDRFRELGSFTLASTHHTALKAYAANTPAVVSANMGFDEHTLAPTYRLELGRPGSSSGIAIAERLGLPAEVVARARQSLSDAHREVEGFLFRLKEDAAAAAQMRADLESRRAAQDQRERDWSASQYKRETERAAQWEHALDELYRSLEERAEQKLKELAAQAPRPMRPQEVSRKASQAAIRLREQAREDLRQTMVAHLGGGDTGSGTSHPAAQTVSPAISPHKAGVGDTVKITSLGRAGVVRGKSGEWLEVEVGHLRTRIRVEDVSEVTPGLPQSGSQPSKPSAVRVRMEGGVREGSLSEINVIGETAEEALRRVDKFLDNAYLASLSRVRVVHGSGKGILRKSLAEMFAEHPHVEKFSPAPQNEGGAGATIVELKL
jgi:DNA mismatch repair protein MutS2